MPDEREELLEDLKYLQFLLNFHVENKFIITMDDAAFEKHTDAIVDRILEIKSKLRDYEG